MFSWQMDGRMDGRTDGRMDAEVLFIEPMQSGCKSAFSRIPASFRLQSFRPQRGMRNDKKSNG